MKITTLAIFLAAIGTHDIEHKPPTVVRDSPTSVSIKQSSTGEPDTWRALSALLERSLDDTQTSDRRLQRKLATCERCHSNELSASNNYLPVLQGQNRQYLARKILDFKTDRRAYHPLQSISQSLSLDEIVFISGFYARQSSPLDQYMLEPPALVDAEPGTSELKSCGQCHGADGNGADLIPAISGQNENYLAYRIREIANGDSKLHRDGEDLTARCSITLGRSSESRRLARILTLALDSGGVIRGETIYRLNCASCHDTGSDGAPSPDDPAQWRSRLANGFRQMERNALLGKRNMPMLGGNRLLSRNQIRDAIHYMLSRTRLFATSAPFQGK
jgi:cytochrome c553/cytochrome c5